MKSNLVIFGAVFILLAGSYSYGETPTKAIDFDNIDATHGRVVAKIYLAKFGITISDVTAGTIVVIDSAKNFYDGRALTAASESNVLTQQNSNDPVSFMLNLPEPVQAVQFTRPALLAGPTGITFPEWNAIALNEKSDRLDKVGEPPRGYYSDEPARKFTLQGHGIRALQFNSKNHHFAAFSAVVIDDLILLKEGVPE